MRNAPTLECQDCGTMLRRLSAAEAQRMAQDPYLFVVYCRPCRAARLPQAEDVES